MTLRALWPVTQQFQNKNGSNLVGGKVYIYYQGRTALATTYHDEAGTVVNPNPVLLDNNGRAAVFADTIYSYTIVVCDYYGKELFSQDITLHDAISTAKDVMVMGSNGSVKVDTTTLPNGVQYDLSVNTDIIATKKSVDDVKTDLNTLTGTVNNHTTQIGQIQEDINNVNSSLTDKKDRQTELAFNGSATKTVKSITQNANGELNVEFADIDLPQEVPNVEITSEDNSVKVTETTDSQTNTKTFDLSVSRGSVYNETVLWKGNRFVNGYIDLSESFLNFEQIRFKIRAEDQDNWQYFYYPCVSTNQSFNANMSQIWPDVTNKLWIKTALWQASSVTRIYGSYQALIHILTSNSYITSVKNDADFLGIYEIVGLNRRNQLFK